MPVFSEPLECRRLFIVSRARRWPQDLSKINTDFGTDKLTLNAVRKSASTTFNLVAAGVKAVETSKNKAAYQKLLAAVQRAGGLGSTKIVAGVSSLKTR